MVRFNIIGTGFVDMAEGSGVAFTTENQQFRFCDISIGRSVSFSIPATDRNRKMLGFAEDANEDGEMLRKVHAAQCVYDGGVVNGTLSVTAYECDTFKVVFRMGWSPALDAVQKKNLKDCVTSYNGGVSWDGTYITADNADPSQVLQVILYDNGGVGGGQWGFVPSVCATTYIADILSNLGLTFTTDLPDEFWLVSGSLKGGTEDAVTFISTDLTTASVTQTQSYFTVVDIDVEWATANLFGALIGGGNTTTKGFKATEDISVNFPQSFPDGVFLIKWNARLSRCETLGGAYANGNSPVNHLQGLTVDLAAGDVVFFASIPWGYATGGGLYYGWKSTDILTGYTFATQVVRNDDITFGETWYLQFNQPDMTVFDFLKSLALATGRELLVDGDTISIVAGEYGQGGDFEALRRVISIDSVTRVVDMWGGNTRKAVVGFDSEDYVTEPLTSTFEIDNEQNEDEKEWKSKFSEGATGANGVVVKDVDGSASPPKFTAKKWTIARATAGSIYLQRLDTPDPVGYDDIAENSTCVKTKVAAPEASLFGLTRSRVFLWRGGAFVWNAAQWASDVLSLTLQRVSQPRLSFVIDTKSLAFTAEVEGVTVRLDKLGAQYETLTATLEYSTNGGVTWTNYAWTGQTGDTVTLANIGDKVLFRGNNATFSTSFASYFKFIISDEVTVSGDVTSLLSTDGGDVALSAYCFAYLFQATPIKNSPNMPSTTLANYCYFGTFYGCDKMETASELPATTLAQSCYHYLFNGCSVLAAAPVLPAETLAASCYSYMFNGCSLIDEVEMHATDISATNCLLSWLVSVAAVGVLRCDPSLTLTSGGSGIPTGWKRQTLEGYQLVEYLESTGTQYIDTGVIGDQDTELVTEWMANSINGQYIYGVMNSGNTASVTAYKATSGYWRFGNQSKSITPTANAWHKTIQNITGIDYDGTLYAYGGTTPSFATPYSIILYCNHTSTGTIGTGFFNGKIKAFAVSSNGVKVIDYYPVVVGGVGYMYDNVAHELHGNDGTGDFVVGADVVG